jgi:ABC-type multidrug transport system fused ATPase/permease subunit
MNIKKIKNAILLFRRAYGAYKSRLSLLVGLGFLNGILEGVGVNALIPLLSFFTTEDRGTDFISRAIEKGFAIIDVDFSLIALLIFIVLLFVLKSLASLFFNYIMLSIKAEYERETRDALYRETLFAEWPHLLNQKLGHLEAVMTFDARMSSKLFMTISSIIMAVTGLLMYFLVALNISPVITLLTLGVGGFGFLLLFPLLRKTRMISHQTSETNKEIVRLVSESVAGTKTLKAFSLEGVFARLGQRHFERLKTLQIKTGLYGNLATAFVQPLSVMFIALLFGISFYYDQSFNFAALAALIYLIHRIFSHIQSIQSYTYTVNHLLPYLRTVLAYQEKMRAQKEEDKGKKKFSFSSSLSFKHVAFSYNTSVPTLENVDFTVQKGEMVGFIGLSGAGKTTVFDLLLRFFRPSHGEIRLDDTNIFDIDLMSFRKKVGYVSQDAFLLDATIAENIRFFNKSVTAKGIEEAAKMAQIHDFVAGLPDKFETVVGGRGVRLSAGQRQRVALARVLARKPEILLLDEATSALDNESERAIQQVIEGLKGRITVLVVAHRLSTVRNSDKLFVLEEGSITESGPPEELLKDKESYFYKMYSIRSQ